MKHVLVACLLVMALCGVSVVGAGTPAAVTESPAQTTIVLGLFDGLQDFIEQLDQFLESIADLLETLQKLFGGSEGGD